MKSNPYIHFHNNVDNLTSLTLFDWTPPVDLTTFKSIESFSVLSPVDVKYKEKIESLPIKRIHAATTIRACS